MHIFCFVLILYCSNLLLAAQDETDPYDAYRNQLDYSESLESQWVEREVRIKSLPQDNDLTKFKMDTMPANMRLYADLTSLLVDEEDWVTRLWLVAKSEQGAYNGTYEGFRCATGEYKIYAYVNPERSEPLRKVELPRWRAIKSRDYRFELVRDYLCNETLTRSKREVIESLDKSATDYETP